MRGIAGALVALASGAAIAVSAGPAAAQRVAVGGGIAITTPLVIDGNGATMRLAPAVHATLDLARHVPAGWSPRFARGAELAGTVRVAHGGVRLSADDARWHVGRATQLDLVVGGRMPLAHGVRARATIGATVVAGPREIAGFARAIVSPLVEAGLDLALRGSLRADIRAQAFRAAPPDGDAGAVGRLLLAVTYAP